MTNPYSYLEITDGTESVLIWNGGGGITDYLLDNNWGPEVAGYRNSPLGARIPFNQVVEEMELAVTGETPDDIFVNIQRIARLLRQAADFANGANVAAVKVKYGPKGRSYSVVQDLVLGPPASDPSMGITLPPNFNRAGFEGIMRGVRVRFMRQGIWIGGDVVAASGSVTQPGVMTATLSSHLQPSPMHLRLAGLRQKPSNANPGWYVLVAPAATDLKLIEAESAAAAGSWATQADAGNLASANNVLRYTPASTAESTGGAIAVSGFSSTTRMVGIFAAVRNNSATTTWRLRVEARCADAGGVNSSVGRTPHKSIDTSTTNPRIINLGTIAIPKALTELALMATASAASGTLDIDYLVLIALDDPRAAAVLVTATGGSTPANSQSLFLDDRILTALTPQATVRDDTTLNDSVATIESYTPWLTWGTTVAAIFMGTTTNNWRVHGGGTPVATTLTVTRHSAYMSP